jgi:arginyl-tRNA synthetase
MKTLHHFVSDDLTFAIVQAFRNDLSEPEQKADVALCMQEEFGHYQCNSALRLGKVLKKNPREVAAKICEHIAHKDRYAKIEIAGPGFINLTFAPLFLSQEVQKQLAHPLLGAIAPQKRTKMIVEFSSPNVAKELHVGHLRSTIIGDCLARLFEFLGYDVLRLNHIGDWGTQFGMLIAYMEESAPLVLSGEEKTDLPSLMGWYRAAKQRFDQDAAFKRKSQLEVVRLQSGEKTSVRAWETICAISRKGYQEIYDLLGVHIEERGESFYNPYLPEIVKELENKNLITISEGAKCLFLEGFAIPLMVQKTDGGYNYDTTDLAAIRYRIFVDKVERIIYVTDLGQSLHFQMIFAAAKKALWCETREVVFDHVGFGLVLGADGKKFKTRSGDTEKLIDLLLEAVRRAKQLIEERSPNMPEAEKEHLAKVLGVGAVKYADLSSSRTKDYTFSYDKMLRFEGNTAVFLLYSFVRIRGIQRKIDRPIPQDAVMDLAAPAEIALGLHLRRFGEVLQLLSEDLCPHRLTEYLYALAEKFNAFFRDCRVEGSLEEASRRLLCELTAKVLQRGLAILGLETVDKM